MFHGPPCRCARHGHVLAWTALLFLAPAALYPRMVAARPWNRSCLRVAASIVTSRGHAPGRHSAVHTRNRSETERCSLSGTNTSRRSAIQSGRGLVFLHRGLTTKCLPAVTAPHDEAADGAVRRGRAELPNHCGFSGRSTRKHCSKKRSKQPFGRSGWESKTARSFTKAYPRKTCTFRKKHRSRRRTLWSTKL